MVFCPAQSLLTQGIAAHQTQNRWMEEDKQTNSKYGKHWFTKLSSPKKRESPLQDVNLENFLAFVRVAYVCMCLYREFVKGWTLTPF